MGWGPVIFAATTLTVSVVVHVLLRQANRALDRRCAWLRQTRLARLACTTARILGASVFAALTSAALFQVIVFIELGYLDPFAPIAFVRSSLFAFFFAAAVGLVIEVTARLRRSPDAR